LASKAIEFGEKSKIKAITPFKVIQGHRGQYQSKARMPALALHCCKAHAKINGKMGNLTPCKIVTPENIILKLCTRDYVSEVTRHANFGFNRYSGDFSPNRRNITTL